MIFASDLDRTLIFSSKFIDGVDANELVCVEYKNDKPISYMLKSATEKIVALSSKTRGITFIPTTTRSVSQFKRIHIFQNVEYAITSNGGTILYHGEPLKEWENIIKDSISEHLCLFDDVATLINSQSFVTDTCTTVDEKFLFFKTNDKQLCREWLENVLDKGLWSFTIQGNKVYILPLAISKEKAISYLAKKLGNRRIICAGDGKLDEGMLRLGNKCIIPRGSGILKCSNIMECKPILVKEGLHATNEIIDHILAYKKHI